MIDRLTLGSVIVGALIGMAALAGMLAPQDPIEQSLSESNLTPGPDHPLGTDRLGRDILARLAYGSRVSLTVAGFATMLAALLGSVVGLAAGATGGRVDRFLMRFVDLMLAFPTLILILVLAALFPSDNRLALVLILGLTTWMPLARLVRSETLALTQQRFMEAATSLGASWLRRAWRHLVPNVASTVVIAATLLIGDMILMESGLSYLGLGVSAPTPTWGDMVRQGMQDLGGAWWVATLPGMALALAVVGFNLVGDGLRDALEPRRAGIMAKSHWGLAPGEARSTSS